MKGERKSEKLLSFGVWPTFSLFLNAKLYIVHSISRKKKGAAATQSLFRGAQLTLIQMVYLKKKINVQNNTCLINCFNLFFF